MVFVEHVEHHNSQNVNFILFISNPFSLMWERVFKCLFGVLSIEKNDKQSVVHINEENIDYSMLRLKNDNKKHLLGGKLDNEEI